LARTPPSTQAALAFCSSSWRDCSSNFMENVFPNPDPTNDLPHGSENAVPAPLPGYDRHGHPAPQGSPSCRGLCSCLR
jgi:hypothetical protein